MADLSNILILYYAMQLQYQAIGLTDSFEEDPRSPSINSSPPNSPEFDDPQYMSRAAARLLAGSSSRDDGLRNECEGKNSLNLSQTHSVMET